MTAESGSNLGPYGPTFQIIPGVQSYDWGKLANEGSLVAQFAEATDELKFDKKGDKPYAEVRLPYSKSAAIYIFSLLSFTCQHPALDGNAPNPS